MNNNLTGLLESSPFDIMINIPSFPSLFLALYSILVEYSINSVISFLLVHLSYFYSIKKNILFFCRNRSNRLCNDYDAE